MIRHKKCLPLFERIFNWGKRTSLNETGEDTNTVTDPESVCKHFKNATQYNTN